MATKKPKYKQNSMFSNLRIIIVSGVIFAVWMIFFDNNNYIALHNLDNQIDSLNKEKTVYINRIKEDSAVITGLKDKRYLEKFARENFLLVRPNEILYIIKQKDDTTTRRRDHSQR